MRTNQLIAYAMFTALSACGGTTQSNQSDISVVGPDIRPARAGEWPSAVAIRHHGGEHCTGTLVAPRLVITAGHCVADTNAGSYKVHFGNGDEPDFGSRGVGVVKVQANPLYEHDVGGDADAAYMVLERDVTDQPIVPVATDPEELRQLFKPGAKGTLVGFGIRDNDTGDSGLKYVGPATIKWHTGNEIWMGDSGGDGCNGDSGGPVYGQLPNGDWRVYGITSRGPSPCGLDPWPGIWGLMHWHLCWIQSASGQTIPSSTLDCSEPSGDGRRDTSLAQMCEDSSASPAIKRTVQALKVVLAAETSDTHDSAANISCAALESWAAHARKLDLSRALIKDLSPIAFFPQLENLAIEDNKVTSVAPLAGLQRLKVLRAGWNDVGDFASLEGRERDGLRIRGRGLQRPSPNFEAQVFERLCNDGQRPGSDAGLNRSMSAIKAYLGYGRDPGCASAATQLRSMRYMDLSDLEITTLEPLRGAAGVQYLRLRGLTINDMAPLAAMEDLQVLDVDGAVIGDLAPLAQLIEDNGLQIIGTPGRPEPTEPVTGTTGDISLPIPDGSTDGVTADVNLQHPGSVRTVGVTLNLAHTYPADLKVELKHPDGTRIVLAERLRGVASGNSIKVTLGQGGTAVTALRNLRGKPVSGTWQVKLIDAEERDSGTLKGVTISVQAAAP